MTDAKLRDATLGPDFPERPVIGLLLRLVYQHYAQDIEAALHGAGFDDIRPGAANVFPFVPPEGTTVSRLAELARVRKQSMAQAVDQLERTGYVERRPNPHDQRSQLVFLTERGPRCPAGHARGGQGRGGAVGRADQPGRVRGAAHRARPAAHGAPGPAGRVTEPGAGETAGTGQADVVAQGGPGVLGAGHAARLQ